MQELVWEAVPLGAVALVAGNDSGTSTYPCPFSAGSGESWNVIRSSRSD